MSDQAREVRPADARQLAAALANADSERLGVRIVGGATKSGWGARPARIDLVIGTRDLRSRCDVDADDLTMTVAAGVTVAEARAEACSLQRVLPLDAARPDRATVGGVAATADQGPRGAAYGRVRDTVLGLKATLADGTSVSFGGRTVKNVAGYDMAKLFVGSLGAFGVIDEITFRLLPQPDTQGLLVVPLASLAEAATLAAKVLDSCLQPLVLEALSGRLAASLAATLPSLPAPRGGGPLGDGPLLLAAFAGHRAAVARSLADVSAWSNVPAATALADAEAEAVLDSLAGLAAAETGSLTARAAVPVSRAWSLALEAESLAEAAGLPLAYRVGAACGTVDLSLGAGPLGQRDLEPLAALVSALRAAAGRCGGRLTLTGGAALATGAATVTGGAALATGAATVTDGPTTSAGAESPPLDYDTWGDLGPPMRLVRRLKDKFDPHHTLNPGVLGSGV